MSIGVNTFNEIAASAGDRTALDRLWAFVSGGDQDNSNKQAKDMIQAEIAGLNSIDEQTAAARKTLDDAVDAAKEQSRLEMIKLEKAAQERKDEIFTMERNLDVDFKGFLSGAIAPLRATERAGVNVRDSLYGVYNPAPTAEKKPSPWPLIAVAAIAAYFVFRRRKKS